MPDPSPSAQGPGPCEQPKTDKRLPTKPKSAKASKEIIEILDDDSSESDPGDGSNDGDYSFINNGSYHNLCSWHSSANNKGNDNDDDNSYEDSDDDWMT